MSLFRKKIDYRDFCYEVFVGWKELLDNKSHLEESLSGQVGYQLTEKESDLLWKNLEIFVIQMLTAQSVYYYKYKYSADQIVETINKSYRKYLSDVRLLSHDQIIAHVNYMDEYHKSYNNILKNAYSNKGIKKDSNVTEDVILDMHAQTFADVYQPDERTVTQKAQNDRTHTKVDDMNEIAYKSSAGIISFVKKEMSNYSKIKW